MMGAGAMVRAGLALLLAVSMAGCAHWRAGPEQADAGPGGGIGGTGRPAETVGVFGTVRGFGSVLVNGVRVPADGGFPVQTPFGLRQVRDLAAGHVVEAVMREGPRGRRTERIAQVIALRGPVDGVRPGARALSVMGVTVEVPADIPLALEGGLRGLRAGARVTVSGLWRNGAVVASRLETAPAAERVASPALVSGPTRVGEGGTVHIGPLLIAGEDTAALDDGGFAIVEGQYRDGRLEATRAQMGHPALPPSLARLSVEAYAGEVAGKPALHGVGLRLAGPARLDRLPGARGVFIGALDGGFRIDHGVPLPEGWAAQAAALESLGDGLQPQGGAIDLR